jgi:hypothetical protein
MESARGATIKNNGPSVAQAAGDQAMRQGNASSHGIISTLIVFLMDAVYKMPRELKQAFCSLYNAQFYLNHSNLLYKDERMDYTMYSVIYVSGEIHI